jgi:hypothetical protein
MDKDQLAVEELKLLQAIIARQDEFKARTKQWAVTVVAAMITARLTGQVKLSDCLLAVVVGVTSLLFMFIEGIFGTAESLAEDRVRVVEEALRNGAVSSYNGPMICDSLLGRITFQRIRKSISYLRIWGFYLALILFGIVPALFKK